MMGKPQCLEPKLFYANLNIAERVPADHPLRRVASVLDFTFVRSLVAPCYGHNGHESLDPTVILKLLYLAFAENIRSERELLRILPCRLDWLWFLNMDLDSPIPHHSVLSKARELWGLETFDKIFTHVLAQCDQAGLIEGRTWHVDSTLLKGHLAADRRIPRVLWNQLQDALTPPAPAEALAAEPPPAPATPPAAAAEAALTPAAPPPRAGRTPVPVQDTQAALMPLPPTGPVNARWLSATDPDAAAFTKPGYGMTVGYKDHRLVDNRHGLIVATLATPADYDDAGMVPALLDQADRSTALTPHELVGDSMYGTQANYAQLPARGIRPYLKKRRARGEKNRGSWLSHLPVACTAGRARALMQRRREVAERSFAVAHARHGHRRCRWRRRWRVQLQCYLVAATQNLHILARHRPGPGAKAGQNPRTMALAGTSAAAPGSRAWVQRPATRLGSIGSPLTRAARAWLMRR